MLCRALGLMLRKTDVVLHANTVIGGVGNGSCLSVTR